MTTVAIVDDERLVLSGFRLILSSDPRLQVVATCDGPAAEEMLCRCRPEVLLLDIHMPHVSGLDVLRRLADHPADQPRPKIAMLTTFASDESTIAALRLGADGFLLKDLSADDLISCVHQLAAGRTVFSRRAAELLRQSLPSPGAGERSRLQSLSPRERDVLELIGSGHSNSEIARRLQLSASTVKDHVSRILDKTGTDNRTQAAVLALQSELLTGGPARDPG